MFPIPVLGFGGLGKPALVHYTVANRIFVAGSRAWRSRRNDHLIDAGSITAVVIFDGPGLTPPGPSALPPAPAPSMAMSRCAMNCLSVPSEFELLSPIKMRAPYETSRPTIKETQIHNSWIVSTAATNLNN